MKVRTARGLKRQPRGFADSSKRASVSNSAAKRISAGSRKTCIVFVSMVVRGALTHAWVDFAGEKSLGGEVRGRRVFPIVTRHGVVGKEKWSGILGLELCIRLAPRYAEDK